MGVSSELLKLYNNVANLEEMLIRQESLIKGYEELLAMYKTAYAKVTEMRDTQLKEVAE